MLHKHSHARNSTASCRDSSIRSHQITVQMMCYTIGSINVTPFLVAYGVRACSHLLRAETFV